MALHFDTDIRTMRAVRRFVHDLVLIQGGSEADASAVEIATGEVLNNAYEHAYAGQSGPLDMDLLYDEAKVELTIHNHGAPIRESPVIPNTPPSGQRGRGLYLVGQLADQSEVIRHGNDHRGIGVRLGKYLRRS
jgi:anti-sigma regulatory factor (Ser/Thr protein kinase)